MTFSMHATAFTIAGKTYTTPATDLSDEQVRHMIGYAMRVKITRASAGVDDDPVKADEKRAKMALPANVFSVDGSDRKSPLETEHLNLFRTFLREKGATKETMKTVTTLAVARTIAATYLPDDATKGPSATRVENLSKILLAKAETIVASKSAPVDADV